MKLTDEQLRVYREFAESVVRDYSGPRLMGITGGDLLSLISEVSELRKLSHGGWISVETASRNLAIKLRECGPHINSACMIAGLHGMAYSGPNYGKDLEELEAALAASPELPKSAQDDQKEK